MKQLDRSVRTRQQMRLAPRVIHGSVSPMSHWAHGEHYSYSWVDPPKIGEGLVQSLGDIVHGHDVAVEEVPRELMTVGDISTGLRGEWTWTRNAGRGE